MFAHSIAAVAAPQGRCSATSDIGNASGGEPQARLAQQPQAEAPKLKIIQRLAHATEVEVVAWSPDGKLLATASGFYRQITLWDALTGKAIRELTIGAPFTKSLAFTADGQNLVTAPALPPSDTNRAALTIWGVGSGAIVENVDGPYPEENAGANRAHVFAFDPARKLLAVIAREGPGSAVAIYDAENWSIKHKLTVDRDTPNSLAFGPRGILAVGTVNGRIALVDVDREVILKTFVAYVPSRGGVESLAFSPDGRHLASGSGLPYTMITRADGQSTPAYPEDPVRIWDTDQGTLACSFTGEFGEVLGLAWSADGHLLASASENGAVHVWSMDSPMDAELVVNFPGHAFAVAFSSDSRRVAVASGTFVIMAEIIR